ncbi:MAG: methyltransferase [Legionellales bacterium RIFCSPHIGHO2_12_FULL_42_9]|nr:MAG: methyltransferase [Legionellales bacterium RIFCSPHIGHO2_12_FULL_42_9]
MELSHSVFTYVFLTIFFLSVGSLLNVVIYRLPLMLNNEWLKECCSLLKLASVTPGNKPVNLFWPRSFCPSCNTQLKSYHNIPLLSYLLLHGECAFCQITIDKQYPLVELSTCLLSLFTVWWFGISVVCLFSLLFIWLLIPITVIDYKHQLLPDSLSLSLLWLGLIANTEALFTSLPNAVLSAAAAYISLWLFIKCFYLLTAKIGMGNGDFKLFAAFGAWFGWTQLPLILLLASVIGSIYGIIYLKVSKQNKETPIPFGPFLSLAGLVSLFFGNQIITFYLSLY